MLVDTQECQRLGLLKYGGTIHVLSFTLNVLLPDYLACATTVVTFVSN